MHKNFFDLDFKSLVNEEPCSIPTNLPPSVMVTGAGGSIGQELCRQLILAGVKVLVLLDSSELALYNLQYLLEKLHSSAKIVILLGSIFDKGLIHATLNENKITHIYHTAAYKHVTLVEQNPFIGMKNNVLGTEAILQAAKGTFVTKVIHVSTDKAVNPPNVMGASKQLAERVVEYSGFEYCILRFGNVIGSSGSALPLFFSQLLNDEPVTLTSLEATRFFMTVKQAVSLVLTAGCMSNGYYVFDMGSPLRLTDIVGLIAKQLGKTSFNLNVIGMRKGEKLHEELTLGGNLLDTSHKKIKRIGEESKGCLDLEVLKVVLDSNDLTKLFDFLCSEVVGYKSAYL